MEREGKNDGSNIYTLTAGRTRHVCPYLALDTSPIHRLACRNTATIKTQITVVSILESNHLAIGRKNNTIVIVIRSIKRDTTTLSGT